MDWSNLQALYDELGTIRAVAAAIGCGEHKVLIEMRKRGVPSKPRGLPKGYVWTEERRQALRAALNRPEVRAKNRARLLKRLPTMSGPSANSPLERLLHGALERAGIGYTTQRVKLDKYVVDIELVQAPVIIEADGARHRLHPEKDALRDAELGAAGYRVFRFHGKAINVDPDGCIQTVIDACDLVREQAPITDVRPGIMGPENRLWRGGKRTFTCNWCGTSFQQYRSNRVLQHTYCSHKCYGEWRRAHPELNPVLVRWAKRRTSEIVVQSELTGDRKS